LLTVSPTDATLPNVTATLDTGVTEKISVSGTKKVFIPARAQATYDVYAPGGLTTSNDPNILEWAATGKCELTVDADATVTITPVLATADNIAKLLTAYLAGNEASLPQLLG
jgi:hypothetical protein